MTFDHLIEHNVTNIFLEKLFRKYTRKASPRPFYKKSKLSISLDQQSEMLYNLFLLNFQVEIYQNILELTR